MDEFEYIDPSGDDSGSIAYQNQGDNIIICFWLEYKYYVNPQNPGIQITATYANKGTFVVPLTRDFSYIKDWLWHDGSHGDRIDSFVVQMREWFGLEIKVTGNIDKFIKKLKKIVP